MNNYKKPTELNSEIIIEETHPKLEPINLLGIIPKKSGIYKIANKITGVYYIGSSKNMLIRTKDHLVKLRKNKHVNKKLQNSWNKHGENSFVFSVVKFVDNENLIIEEQQLLDVANINRNTVYNLNFSANGIEHTEETLRICKEKMKISRKENPEKWKLAIIKGWENNPDRRKNTSDRMKANWMLPEFRKKSISNMTTSLNKPEIKIKLKNSSAGSKNSMYDHTKYLVTDTITGELMICTKSEIKNKFFPECGDYAYVAIQKGKYKNIQIKKLITRVKQPVLNKLNNLNIN